MKSLSLKHPAVFCTLIFLVYSTGLWKFSVPLTGDQKVYLSIALEMFEKKEWIIPSLFGEPNFLKPPLQYWATLMGWKVFGLSIFGALIPSVLALILSSELIRRIGETLSLARAWVPPLLFAGTLGSMTYGSTAQMEIWIVCFFLAAWLALLCSRIGLTFLLVGIMAWIKGPLYPVLFTFGILLWNTSWLKQKKFWGALILGVMVGLSWYALAATTQRDAMMKQFFYQENLGKIQTAQGSMGGLWSEFLFSLFPWVIILVLGVFQREVRTRWLAKARFYIAFGGIPAFFFTVFPYRVNSYLYLLTPIFAMMASEVDLPLSDRFKQIGAGIYFVFLAFLSVLAFRLVQGNWIGIEIAWSCVFACAVFFYGFLRGQWKYVALASLVLVSLVRVSATQVGEKDIAALREFESAHPTRLAYWIDGRDIWHEFGLVSSAMGEPIQRIFDSEGLKQWIREGGAILLSEHQTLPDESLVQCFQWQRLKRRSKFPIQKLLKEGLVWGDPEIMRNERICILK